MSNNPWIQTSDRLPTAEDAGLDGRVWTCFPDLYSSRLAHYTAVNGSTCWLPCHSTTRKQEEQKQLPPNTNMKIGTPNNIEVLLHCHTATTPHPRKDAPAVTAALTTLFHAGCIDPGATPGSYVTTPLGEAWVQAMCNVEIPRVAYVDTQGQILSPFYGQQQ